MRVWSKTDKINYKWPFGRFASLSIILFGFRVINKGSGDVENMPYYIIIHEFGSRPAKNCIGRKSIGVKMHWSLDYDLQKTAVGSWAMCFIIHFFFLKLFTRFLFKMKQILQSPYGICLIIEPMWDGKNTIVGDLASWNNLTPQWKKKKKQQVPITLTLKLIKSNHLKLEISISCTE